MTILHDDWNRVILLIEQAANEADPLVGVLRGLDITETTCADAGGLVTTEITIKAKIGSAIVDPRTLRRTDATPITLPRGLGTK